MTAKKTSTITLRLAPDDRAAVDRLQALLNERTSSRAILRAVHRFPAELARAERLANEVATLRIDLRRLRDAVSAVHNAHDDLEELINANGKTETAI